MFTSTTLLPKLSPEAQAYVLGWSPDHDARQWMKGQTPQWVAHVPIDTLAKAFDISPMQRAGMVARIIGDSVKRFGYTDQPPQYLAMPSTQPTFPFTWMNQDGTASPQWLLAPQETTMAHVYWALAEGHVEAFHVMALQFASYYFHGFVPGSDPMKPTQWSELRNGGNKDQNYGTAGRHRHARGCVDYCVYMLKAFALVGIQFGAEVDFLQGLLSWHVNNIRAKFPLIDNGTGDHLGLEQPFVSTYQTASLRHILKLAALVTTNETTKNQCDSLVLNIDSLLIEHALVANFSPGAPQSWWTYDIAFTDGKPVAPDFTNPRQVVNKGIAGVASYLVPLLADTTHASGPVLYDAMRVDAIANKWPKIHPAETAWAFGTLAL